jgi:hypothetical protein
VKSWGGGNGGRQQMDLDGLKCTSYRREGDGALLFSRRGTEEAGLLVFAVKDSSTLEVGR